MADAGPPPDPGAIIRSRRFVVLLLIAAVVGVIVSLGAWSFLELVHQMQTGVFTDLPEELGYDDGAPMWWYVVVLTLAGLLTAAAIERLPGQGGHVPAHGLSTSGVTTPIELPGVILAAFASIGLGIVLGPEAPLIALGGGLALFTLGVSRREKPPKLLAVVGASGTFAALSMIFQSPLIAAVILLEAAGLSRPQMPLVMLPGLLAAGIGSLVSIGLGSWTGLSTSDYALPALSLPTFDRPDLADFGWTILLAIAVAVGAYAIVWLARRLVPVVEARRFLLLPASGLLVAGLAIAFHEAADHGVEEVLFSGQEAVGPLVADPGAWSLSALALLIVLKGLAYSVSLAGFRGGPVFPALFLGAAAGLMAARLPGFEVTPAVAVGISAGVASMLGLPLAAVVLGVLLTSNAGAGATPLIIVGVVVAFVITRLLTPAQAAATEGESATPETQPAGVG
jgi:H+/Cl- antiporter ClcA